jgi:hypothetical protein
MPPYPGRPAPLLASSASVCVHVPGCCDPAAYLSLPKPPIFLLLMPTPNTQCEMCALGATLSCTPHNLLPPWSASPSPRALWPKQASGRSRLFFTRLLERGCKLRVALRGGGAAGGRGSARMQQQAAVLGTLALSQHRPVCGGTRPASSKPAVPTNNYQAAAYPAAAGGF